MGLLIAVTTCHARRSQAEAQRATWLFDTAGRADVRFFLGGGGEAVYDDEVILDVDDSYAGLPAKVKATMAWARERGYDGVLKLDDDVYLCPERFLQSKIQAFDYAGNFRSRNGPYPADYASGFAYYLSAKAVGIIADAPLGPDTMEDRHVGNVLDAVRPRLKTFDVKVFTCPFPTGVEDPKFLWGSTLGKTAIALAQYPADRFAALHYWYHRTYDVQA